jgi:hypothetical protein
MQPPDTLHIFHEDNSGLKSTSPEGYVTKVAGYMPVGAVILALLLSFENQAHTISLGGVGIRLRPAVGPCANIRDFGAVGDGISHPLGKEYGSLADASRDYPAATSLTDERDWAAIQSALDAVNAAGGGCVYFPPGTYRLGTALTIGSNVMLQGAGQEVTILRDNDPDSTTNAPVGKNPLLTIQGTPSSRVENVRVRDITFRNGVQRDEGQIPDKDGLHADYVDGLVIEDCAFDEIEGAWGIYVRNTSNVTVQRCRFHHWTYAAMMVLTECETIRVLDSVFEKYDDSEVIAKRDYFKQIEASTGKPQLSYTFATGAYAEDRGAFRVKNLWIERNIFRNNPMWEGIDSHGGENLWIRDNYVENVHIGISVGLTTEFVAAPALKNVFIENNRVIQGSGEDDHHGIVVSSGIDTALAENVQIRGNTVIGFGGLTDSTIKRGNDHVGAIDVYMARNVHVSANAIDQYAQAAILLYHTIRDCQVLGNKIGEARGAASLDALAGIYLQSVGLYGMEIRDNILEPSSPNNAPRAFLRANSRAISAQIANNTVKHIAAGASLYAGSGPLPVERSKAPTNDLTQRYGDLILTDMGKPGWYVSAPKIGYGSQVSGVIVKVAIQAVGEAVATIISDNTSDATLTGDYRWLPEGMNITIAGAGEMGGDLHARILMNDGTGLTLDTKAGTAVTGAALTYQGLTLTPT